MHYLGDDRHRPSEADAVPWKIALPLITGLSLLSWGAIGAVGGAFCRLAGF